MSAAFDFSEVERLSASFSDAAARLPGQARSVVAKGSLNIKNGTREHVSDDPTWKRLAQTVNYDMEGNASYSQGTTGYDDEGQGELAGIYEFGSARRSPHPTLMPAFAAEVPRFEKAMGDLVSKVGDSL